MGCFTKTLLTNGLVLCVFGSSCQDKEAGEKKSEFSDVFLLTTPII